MARLPILLLAALALFAADFEVASIKPSSDADGLLAADGRAAEIEQNSLPLGYLHVSGTTVALRNRSFRQLVATAYRVRISEVTGPAWISEVWFDIDAKLPPGAAPGAAPDMLRSLLAQRFGLRAHRETRSASGYALVVAKDGPRLTPASSQPPTAEERVRRIDAMRAEMKKRGGASAVWNPPDGTTAQIAVEISNWLHAPVADETKLSGKYDVLLMVPPPEAADDSLQYRVSQALAKLGLKIEGRKVSVDAVIVDRASRVPTGN
jgi:uncharacterized protein (TIGR03435 family)